MQQLRFLISTYFLKPYFIALKFLSKKMAPIIRLLKFIHSFKFILALIFIWKFHNIIYSLIAFISMFIFNIELKEFLNTIELIYLTFYNYLLEFKLDTYSSFYKNFNLIEIFFYKIW